MALVYVAVFVNDSSLAVAHSLNKVAFIDVSLGPDLVAAALPQVGVSKPVTLVLRSVLKFDNISCFAALEGAVHGIVVVDEGVEVGPESLGNVVFAIFCAAVA